jgi:hypothetical protein
MTNEMLERAVDELNQAMYGPKFCSQCKQVQPVQTYQLEKSFSIRTEDTKLIASFIGTYVCSVCLHPIED